MTNLKALRILAIGDVVGPAGCLCLEACLPKIKQQYKVDVVIANGEWHFSQFCKKNSKCWC